MHLSLIGFCHFSQYSASSVMMVKYHNDEHLVFIVMLGIVMLNAVYCGAAKFT
jgi:hypothetical protein